MEQQMQQTVARVLADKGPSLCCIRAGMDYSSRFYGVVYDIWKQTAALRGDAAVIYVVATSPDACSAARGLGAVVEEGWKARIAVGGAPQKGGFCLMTHDDLTRRDLGGLSRFLDEDKRSLAEALAATLRQKRLVVLLDDMVRPTIESELVMGIVARAMAAEDRAHAVVGFSRHEERMLQIPEEKNPSLVVARAELDTRTPRQLLEPGHIAYRPDLRHQGDDGDTETVCDLVATLTGHYDVVSFLPRTEMVSLELDGIRPWMRRTQITGDGQLEMFSMGADADWEDVRSACLNEFRGDVSKHISCVISLPTPYCNGPIKSGAVGLVVSSDHSDARETFLYNGIVVTSRRPLTQQEVDAQYLQVLAVPPHIPGLPSPRKPWIIANYDQAVQRTAAPERTALTENATTFVLWLVLVWPGMAPTDYPVRGIQKHKMVLDRTLEYLAHVRLVEPQGSGYKAARLGREVLGWSTVWSMLWQNHSAAFLLATGVCTPSANVKAWLALLAALHCWAPKLVDLDSRILPTGRDGLARSALTRETAEWFGSDAAGEECKHPILGNLVRGGHLWLLLARLVRLSADAGFRAEARLPESGIVENMEQLVTASELGQEAGWHGWSDSVIRVKLDAGELVDLYSCLRRAYSNSCFVVSPPQGGAGYTALHINSGDVEPDVSGMTEYLDYLFSTSCRGAKALLGFATHFELVDGRLRPLNFTVLPPMARVAEVRAPFQ